MLLRHGQHVDPKSKDSTHEDILPTWLLSTLERRLKHSRSNSVYLEYDVGLLSAARQLAGVATAQARGSDQTPFSFRFHYRLVNQSIKS